MTVAADRPAVAPAGVRESLRPLALWLPWAAVLAVTLAVAVGLSVPRRWRYLPLLASVLVLGLPHGAVDWAALPRAVTGRLAPRWVGVVLVVYLVAGGAYAAAWVAVPAASAAVFVALTWAHWGQGDLYALTAVVGVDHLDSAPARALTVAVRGGLPMLVPLLAFPDRYRAVVASWVRAFGGTVPPWPITPQVRLGLGLAFGLVTVAALARGWLRATDRRAWAVDAGETGLLWAYFLVVPPVLAVGVYFCCWHSARHVARVLALDGATTEAPSTVGTGPGLRRFAWEAAVPTAGALVVAGALWLLAPSPRATVAGIAGVYLVAIAVLTLPHVVVVTWLDRLQGYW